MACIYVIELDKRVLKRKKFLQANPSYIEGKDCFDVVCQMQKKGITIGTSSPTSTLIDSQVRCLPMLLRASPHYYNTTKEIEFFVSSLKQII